jgi:hypothetical protein
MSGAVDSQDLADDFYGMPIGELVQRMDQAMAKMEQAGKEYAAAQRTLRECAYVLTNRLATLTGALAEIKGLEIYRGAF